MFQFPGFPLIHYVFMYEYARSSCVGFPIQKSAGQWIFAPYRGLSQLITSFVGSQCQGIHLVLFFAWPLIKLLRFISFSWYSVTTEWNCFFCIAIRMELTMKLNQLFLLHSSCCSFHGSTCVSLMAVAFWRLCHSAIEKQAFLCLPDRSAATLVACLDIDVIYLIFDMQFSRCSPDCFTSHPVSGTSWSGIAGKSVFNVPAATCSSMPSPA